MAGKRDSATTTTYAILGLLAAGPSSAYDLAHRMRIGYGFFWPRARSHVFTETKKIARLGWAQGTEHAHGARRRTEYTITRSGRGALRRWLASTPAPFAMESEHLVRVYLAGYATTADLEAVLVDAKRQAEDMLAIAGQVIAGYEAGSIEGPQDEPHLRAILVDFLSGFARATTDWADRSLAEVHSWETANELERRGRAIERMGAMPRLPAIDQPIDQPID